jgi:uncharacterized protein (DUF433 family)
VKQLAEGIVSIPGVCGGQPVIEGRSIPTCIVAAVARVNSREATAEWYELTLEQVDAAVRFEAGKPSEWEDEDVFTIC